MVILTLLPPYSLARVFLRPLKREMGDIQRLSECLMGVHTLSLPTGNRIILGTAVAQWLRCCATIRKVAGSIPDGVIGIFY